MGIALAQLVVGEAALVAPGQKHAGEHAGRARRGGGHDDAHAPVGLQGRQGVLGRPGPPGDTTRTVPGIGVFQGRPQFRRLAADEAAHGGLRVCPRARWRRLPVAFQNAIEMPASMPASVPCLAHSASSRARKAWAMVTCCRARTAPEAPRRMRSPGAANRSSASSGTGTSSPSPAQVAGTTRALMMSGWSDQKLAHARMPRRYRSQGPCRRRRALRRAVAGSRVAMFTPQPARQRRRCGRARPRSSRWRTTTLVRSPGDVHVDAVDTPNDRRAAPDGDAPHLQGAPLAALAADVHGVGVRHLGGRVPDYVPPARRPPSRRAKASAHARVVGRKPQDAGHQRLVGAVAGSRWRRRSRTG